MYEDVDGTTAAPNPITADGNGFWPQRYVTEDAKAVVTTSADVALYTLDPAPTSQGTGATASAISFTPTIDLPQTNVQAAIEGAATLAVSGFAAFGLGITGNAALLSNLDSTGTGAGVYRFDGTTTGTYPTGVAAADTGMIELWRQAGATAVMELHHATTSRVFRRRMTTSVWGAWREIPVVNQATAQGDLVIRGAADFERLAVGAVGTTLVGGTQPSWGGFLIVADEKASGTDGGAAGTGAYFTRTLNTVRANTITGASLASNQITLPAGTYRIDASAPGLRCEKFKIRLRNITDATTTIVGTSEQSEFGGAIVQSRSHLAGMFTIAGSKVFEIQMQATTGFVNGFGQATSFGDVEVYAMAEIQKIG